MHAHSGAEYEFSINSLEEKTLTPLNGKIALDTRIGLLTNSIHDLFLHHHSAAPARRLPEMAASRACAPEERHLLIL